MVRGNDGPIPGENFTSDTKNYPWHRPPEMTDINDSIDYIVKKILGEKKRSTGLVTMMEMGVPIATITDIVLTQGISKGKWTVDMALLMAGPVARIFEMMAKASGVKYTMGIEEDEEIVTAYYFEAHKSPVATAKAIRAGKEAAEEVKKIPPEGGLGSPEPMDLEE